MRIAIVILALVTSSLVYSEVKPESINWLPESFKKELKKNDCHIPSEVKWGEDNTIKLQGITVGQFAKKGQYDIALACGSKVYFYWGGEAKCESEIKNLGESIATAAEDEYQRYLTRYDVKTWPKEIEHDVLVMHYIGKSSFYHYCHNGKWLYSDGAD
jgi:hypothetical protein